MNKEKDTEKESVETEESERKIKEETQEESEKPEEKSFSDIPSFQNFHPVNLNADNLVLSSNEQPISVDNNLERIPESEFKEVKNSIGDYVPRTTTTDRRIQSQEMSTDRRVQAHQENNYTAVLQAPVTLESRGEQRFVNNQNSNLPMIHNLGTSNNSSIGRGEFEKSQKQYEERKHESGPPHMSQSRKRDITKLF